MSRPGNHSPSQDESLEREVFRELIERLDKAAYWTDIDGTIRYVNSGFETQTGYTAAEAVGNTPRLLRSGIHDEQFYDELWNTVLEGDVWEGQVINQRKDGERYTVEQSISPMTNEKGEVVRFLVIAEEVTEVERSRVKLKEQRDNLELLNQIVRHDIRNDLQVANSYIELLTETMPRDGQEYLGRVHRAIHDAIDLTTTAGELSEIILSERQRETIRLQPMLEEVVAEVQSSYPDAKVTFEPVEYRVLVEGDEMLGSVFRNLIKNAIQHNDKEIADVRVSALEDNDSVMIQVADNGPGMPDEYKALFNEEEASLIGSGAGLGLFIVQRVITQHDGEVRVADNEPEGTTFTITLPLKNGN